MLLGISSIGDYNVLTFVLPYSLALFPPSMKILDTKYKGRGIVWIYCLDEREREGTYWTQIYIGWQYLI